MMTSKAEVLAPQTARDIVEAAHSSWNAGSIDGMLQMYVDDLEYITNTGPDGSSLTIHGKEDFRARFEPVMAIMCPRTSIESFHFENGIARVRLSAYARHRGTGLELTGNYRQLIEFRGFQICRLEDFHDAAKMAAFWRLVETATADL